MSAQAVLVIQRSGEALRTETVQGEALIGRGVDCKIRLDDQAVSRKHASLKLIPGGKWEVEAKSEFSPIRHNGREVSRAVLAVGDELSIGPYRIAIQQQEGRADIPSAPSPIQSAPSEVSVAGEGSPSGTTFEANHAEVEPQSDSFGLSEANPDDSFGDSAEVPNEVSLDSPVDQSDEVSHDFAVAESSDSQFGDNGFDEAGSPPESIDSEDLAEVDPDGKTRVGVGSEVRAVLSFLPGTANTTDFEIRSDEVSLGRGAACDIVLNDRKASRKHLIIRRKGLQFQLVDLQSANGTFLNGESVQEADLVSGDLIQVGAVEFRFEAQNLSYEKQEASFDPVDLVEQESAQQSLVESDPNALGTADGFGMDALGTGASVSLDGTASSLSGIAGLPGASTGSSQNKGLMAKFQALPTPRKILIVLAVLVPILLLDVEDPTTKDSKKKKEEGKNKPAATASATPEGIKTFASLSPEDQRFVMNQHQLAWDYFRNKEYDKALFEVRRIFNVIPDYENAREIERYSLEGQAKLQALEEERRKKEEEARLKAQIEQLVSEARAAMMARDFEAAQDKFSPILELDPDNAAVTNWRKEIEAWQEEQERIRMEKQVDEQLNEQARLALREAVQIQESGDFHRAIDAFERVGNFGGSDRSPAEQAKQKIQECKASIAALRDPVLREAKALEDAGDYGPAFRLYEKSTTIDPGYPEGYKGMERIKGALHDRARILYTEGVLAESYSDFTTAQGKFSEILTFIPKEDLYFLRAKRKLSLYRTASGSSVQQDESSYSSTEPNP